MHYSQKRNFFGFWERQIIKVLCRSSSIFLFCIFSRCFSCTKHFLSFLHKQYIVAGLDLFETFQQLVCLSCGFSFHFMRVTFLH